MPSIVPNTFNFEGARDGSNFNPKPRLAETGVVSIRLKSEVLTLEGAFGWLGSAMIGRSAREGEIAVWLCNGNPASTRPNAAQTRIL